jgi:hypothetical protein
MYDRLLEQRCEQMFTALIDDLVEKCRIETFDRGGDWVQEPVIGLYHRFGDVAARTALKRLGMQASEARTWFATAGPSWGQPLPIRRDDIDRLMNAGGRRELLGSYAKSLFDVKWSYRLHPTFFTFGCNVMANRADLRKNAALLQEFPPATGRPDVERR